VSFKLSVGQSWYVKPQSYVHDKPRRFTGSLTASSIGRLKWYYLASTLKWLNNGSRSVMSIHSKPKVDEYTELFQTLVQVTVSRFQEMQADDQRCRSSFIYLAWSFLLVVCFSVFTKLVCILSQVLCLLWELRGPRRGQFSWSHRTTQAWCLSKGHAAGVSPPTVLSW